MATIAEILAAKKAAQATATPAPSSASVEQSNAEIIQKTLPEPVKKEEPAIQAPKPLSFAEKMALKKAEEHKKAMEGATVQNAETATAVTVVPSVVVQTTSIPATVTSENKEEQKEQETADAQAYADIKAKIDALTELTGENLETAMSDLKKALLQNPSATSLMQDSDIGQMVIALRKITGEAVAEAAKDGRKTKVKATKNKDIDLTDPNVVAQVLDQL